MPDVVALALPAGTAFVDALKAVWDAGDAAFPLDLRLPKSEQDRVLSVIAPTAIVEQDGERRGLASGHPAEAGDALVMATSGTTGLPKGVILTHDAVAASATATSHHIGVDPQRHTWLACLPVAHVGGLSVITRALLTSTPLVVHDRFSPEAATAAAHAGVTHTSLVTRALSQIDPADFEAIVIGGAAPPADRAANVYATYGMTETGSGVVYNRHPIKGVEIAIAESGEIHLQAPMLLRAYRQRVGVKIVDTDPKTDGWFATGDLGGWNDDGSLFVSGRKQEVIMTGGEKVWPARTESVLAGAPGVADVAVVGVAHPEWGHELVALVVASPDRQPLLDGLRDLVKESLPVWYAPRRLIVVEAIPRTALGKIKRAELSLLMS